MRARPASRHRETSRSRPIFLPSIVLLLFACGGGGGSSPTTPTSPIAGAYTIAVELVENNCGAVTVQPQATSVSHSPGATRFTLQHGANAFSATLAADNSFVADPLVLQDQDGSTLTVRLQGSFVLGAATTLDATVTVDVTGRPSPPASCRYVVHWSGPKSGG